MKNIDDCIKAIAFDADDTLWDSQTHFVEVENEYCRLLADYGDRDAISAALFSVETANMDDLGYGCKAFTISLVENAVKVSRGRVEADVIGRIVELGKSLLHLTAKPLEGVEDTLRQLHTMTTHDGVGRRFRLAVFTKGELQDQENKLRRSGLAPLFDHVQIVSDKTPEAYVSLCRALQVAPRELLMVGNSFRSDIAPALEIGAHAAYVPFHTTWAHEKTDEYAHPRLRRLASLRELAE